MNKRGKVKKIKSIINEWGTTTSGELSLETSPVYGSIGDNVVGLVEYFNNNTVTVVVYCDDQEIDEFDVRYEDLSKDVIDEIFEIMDEYDTDMEKTEKRCKD